MNLTPRLQVVAKHVPKNTICGDIGTDHAYIPLYLIKNGICPKVIATDVNKGPINIAQEQINSAGYSKYIETRLGDGLQPIKPREINSVVIAGMGGLLIRNILEASPEVTRGIKTFILQPMVAQRELKEYLLKNNYTIIEEDLAQEDRRIYEIIIATHGKQDLEHPIFLDVGKSLIDKKHPLLKPLIHGKKAKLQKIVQQCEGKRTINAEERIKECLDKIQSLEEVGKWL